MMRLGGSYVSPRMDTLPHRILSVNQLSSNINRRQLHTTFHRIPASNKYLLLARKTGQILVAAERKLKILEISEIKDTVEPGDHPAQARKGGWLIAGRFSSMNEVGLPAVRINP